MAGNQSPDILVLFSVWIRQADVDSLQTGGDLPRIAGLANGRSNWAVRSWAVPTMTQ